MLGRDVLQIAINDLPYAKCKIIIGSNIPTISITLFTKKLLMQQFKVLTINTYERLRLKCRCNESESKKPTDEEIAEKQTKNF